MKILLNKKYLKEFMIKTTKFKIFFDFCLKEKPKSTRDNINSLILKGNFSLMNDILKDSKRNMLKANMINKEQTLSFLDKSINKQNNISLIIENKQRFKYLKLFLKLFQKFNLKPKFLNIKIRWVILLLILFIINYGNPKNILSK